MRGQVNIKLFDENGNLKKEVEGHNLITNALNYLFNPPFPEFFECYTPTAYKSNPINYYTPIAGNSIGGVMLFNETRDESINHILPNSEDFMKYIVDRIEEGFAVCEDGQKNFINIPLEKFNQRPVDGDSAEEKDGRFFLLKDVTEKSKFSVRQRFEKLKKK